MLDSFIYPSSFLDIPIREIAKIIAKLEAGSTSEYDIKLRRGGIRDIEFIVQTLQLLNAGTLPELKTQNTLNAIENMKLNFSPRLNNLLLITFCQGHLLM